MSVVAAPAPQAAARAAAPARSPWIVGAWSDLALFVATPLLILPLFFLLKTRWAATDMALLIVALGGVGHHLPGMMRAYGDRELFERYRLRFVVAPLLLVAGCVFATIWNLAAAQLVLLFWALWHTLAQTYGFLRIYDAKAGSFAAWTRRLDRAMCLVWFTGAALFSAPRLSGALTVFYQSGGPELSPAVVQGLRTGWAVLAGLITFAFIANYLVTLRRGEGQSPIKLLLLATSVVFWWFCMTSFPNVIIGIALFELFHDSQYLGIVWVYNKNRLTRNPDQRGFLRFAFRRSGVLIALYIGLVLLYGYGSFVVTGLQQETLRNALLGVVLASTLLHYYYDGFIWRVREQGTRETLGVSAAKAAGEAAARPGRKGLPAWALHAGYWSLLAVVAGGFAVAQVTDEREELDWRRAVVEAVPDSSIAQNNYGAALVRAGRRGEAEEAFRRALALDGESLNASVNLASVLLEDGRAEEARPHFERALRIDPGNATALAALAREPDDAQRHVALAAELLERGEHEQAIAQYEAAVALLPTNAELRYNLGLVLQSQGHLDRAVAQYREALRIAPEHAQAHNNLGLALQGGGDHEQAALSYERAIELDPGYAIAHMNLALLLHARGEAERALTHLRRALESRPDYAKAHYVLGLLLKERGELDQAGAHLERALASDPALEDARRTLAEVRALNGN